MATVLQKSLCGRGDSHLNEDLPVETSHCKKSCMSILKISAVFAGTGLVVFALLGVSHALGHNFIPSKAYSWLPSLAHNPTWYYYSSVATLALGGVVTLGMTYIFSQPPRKALTRLEVF